MMTNQIGDLDVKKMISPLPARSKKFDLFPGVKHKRASLSTSTSNLAPMGAARAARRGRVR